MCKYAYKRMQVDIITCYKKVEKFSISLNQLCIMC